jgi:ankyrin
MVFQFAFDLIHDAILSSPFQEQQTPLHIAARLGNVDNVMLLLQHGASPNATTKDLYTPLHIAAKEGQEEVASVLLEHGASLDLTTKVCRITELLLTENRSVSLPVFYVIN